LVAVSIVVSLVMAPMFSLTSELIVGAAPPERAGAASAISETGSEVGGAVGIAILGSAGTAAYPCGRGAGLGDAPPPASGRSEPTGGRTLGAGGGLRPAGSSRFR
jgi:DHA2 family multidrug resistance protein-like MFS transporter